MSTLLLVVGAIIVLFVVGQVTNIVVSVVMFAVIFAALKAQAAFVFPLLDKLQGEVRQWAAIISMCVMLGVAWAVLGYLVKALSL